MGPAAGNYKNEYLDVFAQRQAKAAQRRNRRGKNQAPGTKVRREDISGPSELTELWDGEDRKPDPLSRTVVVGKRVEHRIVEIFIATMILSAGMLAGWSYGGNIDPVFPLLFIGSLLFAAKC